MRYALFSEITLLKRLRSVMAAKRHFIILTTSLLVLGAVMVTFLLTFAITYHQPLQRLSQRSGVKETIAGLFGGTRLENYQLKSETTNQAALLRSMESVSSRNLSLAPPLKKEHYFVLVMVLTRPNSSDWREVIRNTWAKNASQGTHEVKVLFSVGTGSLHKKMLDELHKEQRIFGDLLFLPNVCDSYDNLTLKVLCSFVKASNSYSFTYLLKIDTDTFIIFDAFLNELRRRTSKKSYYWGFMHNRLKVNSDGKNAEHKWFLSDKYLPFAVGPAYVLSGDLVKRIATNAEALTMYHNEDVSVGVWLSSFNMERKHDERFVLFYWRWTCYPYIITANPVSISQIYSMQKNYEEKGKVC